MALVRHFIHSTELSTWDRQGGRFCYDYFITIKLKLKTENSSKKICCVAWTGSKTWLWWCHRRSLGCELSCLAICIANSSPNGVLIHLISKVYSLNGHLQNLRPVSSMRHQAQLCVCAAELSPQLPIGNSFSQLVWVVHTYNPSSGEAEARGLLWIRSQLIYIVPGQPGLQSETVLQKQNIAKFSETNSHQSWSALKVTM